VGESDCSNPDTCDASGNCAHTNDKADLTSCGATDYCAQRKCFGGTCQWAALGLSFASEDLARAASTARCNQGRTCYTYTCDPDNTFGGSPAPCVPGSLKVGNPCPAVTDPICEKLCCQESAGTCTKQNLCGDFPAVAGRRLLEVLAAGGSKPKATAFPL
jgi:hypothetical protein